MQGKIAGEANRASTRKIWSEAVVPALVEAEIRPIAPLLAGRRDLVALDVGANKGYWAKGFLNTFGDAVAHIHMIEPSPENCRELSRIDDNLMFAATDFPRLSVHQLAAGARAGIATLYTNEDGSPLASLYPHTINGYAPGDLATIDLALEQDVTVTTIDLFVAAQSCPPIDIMKIDVEGHEMAVLEGAAATLERGFIDLVSLEFGMHQVESRHFFRDFHEFFSDLGFRLHFVRDGMLETVSRYEYRYENFTDNFQLIAQRDPGQHAPARAGHPDPSPAEATPTRDIDLLKRRHARAICDLQREFAREREDIIALFHNSTSWRLTKPLRGLARMWKR
jgi:FkbM family methyltransferase